MAARNIYGKRKFDYQKELRQIQNWRTHPKNKEVLAEWHEHLFATGSKEARVCKLSVQFRRIITAAQRIRPGIRVDELEIPTIKKVVAGINRNEKWSLSTRADYRRCLKQFLLWYEDNDPRLEEPPEIDITASEDEMRAQWRTRQEAIRKRGTAQKTYQYVKKQIDISYEHPQLDPAAIITDEDLRLVIRNGTRCSRDRAFLGVLHEAGLRSAEMLNLRLCDLEMKADKVVLHVDGKTGKRPVPIVLNVPYLIRWLEDHPFKDNPNSLLWVSVSSNAKGEPLFHHAARKLVLTAFKRAGVTKKHNLHWFRHSRASLYYGRMTEGEMCDFFGWTKGSDMIKTYSHTKNEGAESAIFRIHGLKPLEQAEKTLLQCAACGIPNEPGRQFCGRCGRPLSLESHKEKERYLQLAFEMMGKVMADPDLRKEFEQFCQQQKKDA